MMVTVLAFFLTLGVLIVVHEYGHYRVAVACGVKVLRFSVGFGRVLWRRQPRPDGTEFVVCALPFGGYVRMLDEREGDVAPPTRRAFNRKPLWQRAAIVAAGPIANLALAVALYATAHWIGVDEPKAVLGPPVAASVAEKAGMRAGDWVRAWSQDGGEWHDIRSLIDLRWQVTQAMLHGEDIDLLVSGATAAASGAPIWRCRRWRAPTSTPRRCSASASATRGASRSSATSRPAAPARGGLKPGDRIVAIDGVAIDDASQVIAATRESGKTGVATPMQWRLERGASRLDIVVTPAVVVDKGNRIGRIETEVGRRPEFVRCATVRSRG
jgi:regulator of sigma E protease